MVAQIGQNYANNYHNTLVSFLFQRILCNGYKNRLLENTIHVYTRFKMITEKS